MKVLKKTIILVVLIITLVLIFSISASANKFGDFLRDGIGILVDNQFRTDVYVSDLLQTIQSGEVGNLYYYFSNVLPPNFDGSSCIFLADSTLADIQYKMLQNGIPLDMIAVTAVNGDRAWMLCVHDMPELSEYSNAYLTWNGDYLVGVITGSSAVQSEHNYYTENNNDIAINKNNYDYNTNNITVNNQTTNNNEYNNIISNDYEYIYDIHNGDSYEIGSISYDAGDQNYEITYVDDNDITQTVYVTYNVQYTIVEYVGLDQTYVCYYELPDGRSSADLTVEDLEFLATGYDIVNYGVESDDIRLRALYHFDGNTADDSYFGFMSDFEWILNPSITYLDAYEWGGCLYLDDLAHQFKITLPSTISTGDFSVMWRMYTGYSDTSTAYASANSLSVGDTKLMYWNETSIGYSTGTTLSDLPIGSWVELALIRNDGRVYLYCNGISVGSYSNSNSFNSEITFNFVAATKNTEYLDELRVFNYAVVETGLSYNPITAPQDTNLVLVLPDAENVVIDNYWTFDESVNLAQNNEYPFEGNTYNFQDHTSDYVIPTLNGVTAEAVDDFVRFTSLQTTDIIKNIGTNFWYSGSGIDYIDAYCKDNVLGCIVSQSDYSQYLTFTVCLADGEKYSISRNRNGGYINGTQFGGVVYNYISYYYDCGDFYITSSCRSNYNGDTAIFFSIYIKPGKSIDLSYYEVTQGTTPSSSLKYESFIYDLGSLTAPTIAVRSRVPVTDYRIGGVRPTIAEKGMVWMQVENQRITNCLIHDGYGWVQVDIRIWTGSRWAPPSAYDVFTMQDLWDVVGTTGGVLIVDEQGFWYWFVGAWDDLKSWFEQLIDSINALDLSVTIDPDNDVVINVEHDINQWFGDDINDPDIPDNGNSLFDWIKDVFNINAKFKVTIFGDKDAAYEPAWDLLDMFSNTGSPIFGLNNAGDDFWEFDGGGTE